jgi:hypothetical protein
MTLAMLFSLKGVGNRAYYRWLKRDYLPLFPHLPERTRLFRLFNSHRHHTDRFMAEDSLIGLVDTYGIELLHPRREGRSKAQIGRKGMSNQRWIVGGKLCFLLNHIGLIVDWDVDTANVYDGSAFQEVVDRHVESMAIFADTGFAKTDWQPDNLRSCKLFSVKRAYLRYQRDQCRLLFVKMGDRPYSAGYTYGSFPTPR